MPIAGISPSPGVLGGLALTWGVRPLGVPDVSDGGEQLRLAVRATLQAGLARAGDLVAVVFGSAGPRAGSTDTVRVVRA
jgi:pyruvate kinase